MIDKFEKCGIFQSVFSRIADRRAWRHSPRPTLCRNFQVPTPTGCAKVAVKCALHLMLVVLKSMHRWSSR